MHLNRPYAGYGWVFKELEFFFFFRLKRWLRFFSCAKRFFRTIFSIKYHFPFARRWDRNSRLVQIFSPSYRVCRWWVWEETKGEPFHYLSWERGQLRTNTYWGYGVLISHWTLRFKFLPRVTASREVCPWKENTSVTTQYCWSVQLLIIVAVN